MRPDFAGDDAGDGGCVDAKHSGNGAVGCAFLGAATDVADVLFGEDGKPVARPLGGGQFAARGGARLGLFVVLPGAVALATIEAAAIALGGVGFVLGAGHARVSAGAVAAAHQSCSSAAMARSPR